MRKKPTPQCPCRKCGESVWFTNNMPTILLMTGDERGLDMTEQHLMPTETCPGSPQAGYINPELRRNWPDFVYIDEEAEDWQAAYEHLQDATGAVLAA